MPVHIKKVLTGKETVAKIDYYILRIFAVLYIFLFFLPGVNPAKITERMNKNISLFTSGFFYKSLTAPLDRFIKNGWIPLSSIRLDFFSSMVCCLSAILIAVGGCVSVGNNKLKRIGNILMFAGGLQGFIGILGINCAKNQLQNFIIENPGYVQRVKALDPFGIRIFFVMCVAIAVLSVLAFILTPAPQKDEKVHIEAKYKLFLMLLPFLFLIFLFAYLPLSGWRFAFFDYNPGANFSTGEFRGFYWFTYLFKNVSVSKEMLLVLRNTIVMSVLGIATSWLPMFFAIFLSEINNRRIRRFVQTCSTIPNFISWVLVYAIAVLLFGKGGFVSNILANRGILDSNQNLLTDGSHTWLKMWAWGVWKGLGWNALIYLAAINGIDRELYDAATIDGAGRLHRIKSITLPTLLPIYMILLILSVAGILSNGLEQYLCFANQQNVKDIQVLDLYIYKIGLKDGLVSFSTVVGMVQSLVSIALLFAANRIAKFVCGKSVI